MSTLDWRPLALADPVPGDPGLVRAVAQQHARAAVLVAEQAQAVRRVAAAVAGGAADPAGGEGGAGGPWSGPAAEAFRLRAAGLPRDLMQVAARQHRVAVALLAYAPELESCQRQARRALDRAHLAQGRAGVPVSSPVGVTPILLTGELPPAQQELVAEIAHCLRLVRAAVEHRDWAAARCTRALQAAGDDGLRDPHGWHHVLLAVSAVAGTVSTWLGVAAVLLCWVPGAGPVLGAVALSVAGVSLLTDLALTAYGDKGWTDVGLDVAGVLPAGRALRIAAALPHEATQARAVARAAVQLDALGQLRTGAGELARAGRARTWGDLLRSPGGLLDEIARARELRRGGATLIVGGHAVDAAQAGLAGYASGVPARDRTPR